MANTVNTVGPQKQDDASHDYFITLLSLALNYASDLNDTSELVLHPHPGQARAIRMLERGEVFDVLWSAESEQRDAGLIKVDVPLMHGGLGWRGLVVLNSRRQEFSQLDDFQQLMPLVFCQGKSWPDADILERNGLQVVRVLGLDNMYEMLRKRRCDVLPLSIFEGQSEVELVRSHYPELVFIVNPSIRYSLGMYFYVSPDKPQLAQQLQGSLEYLQRTGELQQFMRRHTLTRDAFPLSQYSQIIELN